REAGEDRDWGSPSPRNLWRPTAERSRWKASPAAAPPSSSGCLIPESVNNIPPIPPQAKIAGFQAVDHGSALGGHPPRALSASQPPERCVAPSDAQRGASASLDRMAKGVSATPFLPASFTRHGVCQSLNGFFRSGPS